MTSSIVSGSCESSSVLLLLEKQGYLLVNPVGIDLSGQPGTYNSDTQLLSGVVWPAGSRVISYYLHFDPVGNPSKSVTPADDPLLGGGVAMIQFDPTLRIIGIQVQGGTLNNSARRRDSSQLQISGLTYDTANAPGLELGTTANGDWVQIVDYHTVLFKLDVSGGNVDDFRLLLETPEPATLGLIGLGLLGVAALRRRRTREIR